VFTKTTARSTTTSGGSFCPPSVSSWCGRWRWRRRNGEERVPVNRDFRDLFAALNAAGARYLLVGGYAVAFHAQPRFTTDPDVWTEASPGNAPLVYRALQSFGAPLEALTVADLEREGVVFQIGVPPNRIDIVTSIDGVGFDEAWPGRVGTTYGDQAITVIGRAELIRNKRASGRPQDLLDLSVLERS